MGFTVDHENLYTGGWTSEFRRVTFVDGEFDPWIGATLNSPSRPGGPVNYSDEIPVWVIKNGNHVADLVVDELDLHEVGTVEKVYEKHGEWLGEWMAEKRP